MPEKFFGRSVVLDPKTGDPAGYEAYVCVLLTETERQPGVTLAEARTLDELIGKMRADDISPHFLQAKLSFEPPPGDYPINHSLARQRYEALALDELYKIQGAFGSA